MKKRSKRGIYTILVVICFILMAGCDASNAGLPSRAQTAFMGMAVDAAATQDAAGTETPAPTDTPVTP